MQEPVIFPCTVLFLQSSSGLSPPLAFESSFFTLKKYVKEIIWSQDQSNFYNENLQLFKEMFWVWAFSVTLKIFTCSPKSLFFKTPTGHRIWTGLIPALPLWFPIFLSSLLVFGSLKSSFPILIPTSFLAKMSPAASPQFMKPEQSTKIGMVEYAKFWGQFSSQFM